MSCWGLASNLNTGGMLLVTEQPLNPVKKYDLSFGGYKDEHVAAQDQSLGLPGLATIR